MISTVETSGIGVKPVDGRNVEQCGQLKSVFTTTRKRTVAIQDTSQSITDCFKFICTNNKGDKGCGKDYPTIQKLQDHFEMIKNDGMEDLKKQHEKFYPSTCRAVCLTCPGDAFISRTSETGRKRHISKDLHQNNIKTKRQDSAGTTQEYRSEPEASRSNKQETLSIEKQQLLLSTDTASDGDLPATERKTELLSKEPEYLSGALVPVVGTPAQVGIPVQMVGIPVAVSFLEENGKTILQLSQSSRDSLFSGGPDEYTDSSSAKIMKNNDELSLSSSKEKLNEIAGPVEKKSHCSFCVEMTSNLESMDPAELFSKPAT